jgi:hypothetical protein
MAHIGGEVYTSIKEAIKMSSEPFGIIATYLAPNGAYHYFINGKPKISISAPKK